MVLSLDLTADLEQRLIDEAGRHGVPPEPLAVQVLKRHLPESDRHRQFAALLQSWIDEDPQEQIETFEFLVHSLGEDRPSERKLFPPSLKGISW